MNENELLVRLGARQCDKCDRAGTITTLPLRWRIEANREVTTLFLCEFCAVKVIWKPFIKQ